MATGDKAAASTAIDANNKADCIICGAPLIYLDALEPMVCERCGRTFESDCRCEKGHYICDECHEKDAVAITLEACAATASDDPIDIMVQVMRDPAVHMHGPEHHVLVGAALIAAYDNAGGEIDRDAALKQMLHRGSCIPGGVCGFWGCCGAAASSGMFASIVLGSTPLKNEEWKLSQQLTSRALDSIAELGGPRCCKRDSFRAAEQAVAWTKEQLDVQMHLPKRIVCEFSDLNKECIHERCPYYLGNRAE